MRTRSRGARDSSGLLAYGCGPHNATQMFRPSTGVSSVIVMWEKSKRSLPRPRPDHHQLLAAREHIVVRNVVAFVDIREERLDALDG